MVKNLKRKFVFERAILQHTKNIFRTRIKEDRNLKKGIRLNRNERVLDYPNSLLSKIFKKTNGYHLAKYPDQSLIYNYLSKYLNLKEKNFYISNGIDGSIKSIFEIFTKPKDKILCLHPSYAMYEIYSKIFRTKFIKVDYDYDNFKLKVEDLFKKIKKKPKILFLPNPNQPIEDNFSLNQIEKICLLCKKNKVLLVIDEAYYMFGSSTAQKLIFKYENIVILRTFSKSFGLPSVRIGYAISSEKIINILKAFRLSYESNFLSDAVVIYFLKRKYLVNKYINQVIRGRNYLSKKINQLGFKVIGKESNFLLIDLKDKKICEKVYKGFLKDFIYVKGNYKYPLDKCLLLTCGPIKVMKKVFLSFKKILNKC